MQAGPSRFQNAAAGSRLVLATPTNQIRCWTNHMLPAEQSSNLLIDGGGFQQVAPCWLLQEPPSLLRPTANLVLLFVRMVMAF